MIVLDTSVLLYALGTEHPVRDPCRALIAAIAKRDVEASTTTQVIQEFAHVRARRRPREDAAKHANEYVDLLGPLIDVPEAAVRTALRLFAAHERLDAFDSVLAAASMSPTVTALVSADRAYADVPGIHHVFPDDAGVATLLGG